MYIVQSVITQILYDLKGVNNVMLNTERNIDPEEELNLTYGSFKLLEAVPCAKSSEVGLVIMK